MSYEFLFVCDEFQGDYTQPKCGGKQVVVHLFEWSWDSIARECEEVTGSELGKISLSKGLIQ